MAGFFLLIFKLKFEILAVSLLTSFLALTFVSSLNTCPIHHQNDRGWGHNKTVTSVIPLLKLLPRLPTLSQSLTTQVLALGQVRSGASLSSVFSLILIQPPQRPAVSSTGGAHFTPQSPYHSLLLECISPHNLSFLQVFQSCFS